jgi:Flp pilus assembly protein TadG
MAMQHLRPGPTQRVRAGGHNPSERGQSLVEMALAMIFLVWLIAVIIDMGSALFTWIALRDAAQEGALYGSVNPTDTPTIKLRVVTSSDRPLDLVQAYEDGTLEINPTIGGSACTGGAITVMVRYQYTPIIPLVSAIWPTIPIRATVTDTILLPECPP